MHTEVKPWIPEKWSPWILAFLIFLVIVPCVWIILVNG